MLKSILRCLLPGSCLLCNAPIDPSGEPSGELDLCHFCLEALPWNHPACSCCGHPVPIDTGWPCVRCRELPWPFTRVIAPLRYEGFPQTWIGRLKDRQGMVEGRLLGTLLADAAEHVYRGDEGPPVRSPDLLIPVPLTAFRLARRGHNQALTLARPVAARLDVPVLRRAVARRRSGRRQRGLGRAERLRNPAGGFASRRRWHARAPCIAIVDDVMTTGATVAELARVLLAAGAAEVHVLAAARTPLHRYPWGTS